MKPESRKITGFMKITESGDIEITIRSRAPGVRCPDCGRENAYKRIDGSIKCYRGCGYDSRRIGERIFQGAAGEP